MEGGSTLIGEIFELSTINRKGGSTTTEWSKCMHVCTRGGSTACMCVRIIPSSNRRRAITTNAIFQADR